MKLITRKDFLSRAACRELIEGYSEGQLTGTGYDFRAGTCSNLTTPESAVSLEGGTTYRIHHGDRVIIKTREKLNLRGRDDIWGIVFSKNSYALKGLSHLGTKIDPGFKGALAISFNNSGYDTIEINENTSICNVALIEIPHTGQEYAGGESNEPLILGERPPLPFPLTKENWEDESLGLRRFYSKEAFDSYLQWSNVLYQKIEKIQAEFKLFEESMTQKEERSERIFFGAVLTMFVSAIAVTGVLVSAAALFLNEIRAQVQGGKLEIPISTLIVIVLVFFIIFYFLARVLLGRKYRI